MKKFLFLLLLLPLLAKAQYPAPTGISSNVSTSFFYKISGGDTTLYAKAANGLWFPVGRPGVFSFNGRIGVVTLTSSDVTTALGYTPTTNTRTLTINGTTFDLSANRTWSVGDALVANPLSQFAATTSAQLRAVLSDETGTGSAYFQGGSLGTPSGGTATNLTGLPLTTGVTGILGVANGGTGTASPGLVQGTGIAITGSWPNQTINGFNNPMTTTGDIIYSSSGSTAARLGIGGAHTLIHGGTTPSYSAVDLTADVTGLLPNANLANSAITIQGTSTSLGGSVNPINGTGFVKASGTTISYDNSTYTTSTGTNNYLPIYTGASTISSSNVYKQSSSSFSVSGSDYINGDRALTTQAARYAVSDNILLGSGAGHHGFGEYSDITQSGTNGGFASFDSKTTMSGSGNYNHLIGFQTRPSFLGSGALVYMAGFDGTPTYSGAGVLGDYYGVAIRQLAGSGVVTNYKGLYIEDVSTRSSNAFSIYTNGGKHYFGGDIYNAAPVYSTGTYNLLVNNNTTGRYESIASLPISFLSSYTISGNNLGTNLPALSFGTHLTSGGSSYNGTAAVTITSDATSSKTASTIVSRDGSGFSNFETVGIGTNNPVSLLDVTVNQAKTNASNIFYGYIGKTNESSNYAALQLYMSGGAAQGNRSWIFQTAEAGVANAGTISLQPSGGSVSVGGVLQVSGSTSTQHIIGLTSTPTIAAGAGAGTSPTITITGNDVDGVIKVVAGTSPSATSTIVTVTFNTAYAAAPNVSITPGNGTAAITQQGTSYVICPAVGQSSGPTTTTFTLQASGALTAASTYVWTYHVFQ
jgi:hypothetical protein